MSFFTGCPITTLNIGDMVQFIPEYAFATFTGYSSLNFITTYAVIPPLISYYAFLNVLTNTSVYVPNESLDYYINASGWGDYFTNISPLDIDENKTTSNVTIYPNPTTGELNIMMSDTQYEMSDLMICDILGKIQKIEKQKTENTIDISHLSAGIYFVKISTKAGEIVRKIVKE